MWAPSSLDEMGGEEQGQGAFLPGASAGLELLALNHNIANYARRQGLAWFARPLTWSTPAPAQRLCLSLGWVHASPAPPADRYS